jgi:Cytochrome domain of cellobiose dehydrogenase
MLFNALSCFLFVLAGFAKAQVAVQTGMTSDSHCGIGYCFTALYSPSNKMINYTLIVPQGDSPLGWYGVAQGTEMENANMAINWVNNDKTLTTSHRSAKTMIEPKASEVTVKEFSLNLDISMTMPGMTIWSWNMPMTKDQLNAVKHVFAYSITSPSSPSVDATLVKHIRHDTGISLDLTKNYDGSPPAYPNGSTPMTVGSMGGSSDMGDSMGGSMAGMHDTTSNASTTSVTSALNATSASNATSAHVANNASTNMQGKITLLFLLHILFCVVAWQLCVN